MKFSWLNLNSKDKKSILLYYVSGLFPSNIPSRFFRYAVVVHMKFISLNGVRCHHL